MWIESLWDGRYGRRLYAWIDEKGQKMIPIEPRIELFVWTDGGTDQFRLGGPLIKPVRRIQVHLDGEVYETEPMLGHSHDAVLRQLQYLLSHGDSELALEVIENHLGPFPTGAESLKDAERQRS